MHICVPITPNGVQSIVALEGGVEVEAGIRDLRGRSGWAPGVTPNFGLWFICSESDEQVLAQCFANHADPLDGRRVHSV